MDDIKERLKLIFDNLGNAAVKANRSIDEITVMAVTKTVEPELVNQAISAGITLIGENRVQEFLGKREKYSLPTEKIHFIGGLQSNKVKYIIDKVGMIESVSSLSLALEINKRAMAAGITMPALLEVNISEEETKNGFREAELLSLSERLFSLPNLNIKGLMVIPSRENTEYWFEKTNELFLKLQKSRFGFDVLSMGMSQDYQTAVLHGATIVRLGSAIFGTRK